MPNGNEMLDELQFDKLIKGKTDRELSEFTARQVFELCREVEAGSKRIDSLESHDRKTFGIAGGIGGGAATVLGVAIVAILKRFGIDIA